MAYLETISGGQEVMSACKMQEIDSLPLVADEIVSICLLIYPTCLEAIYVIHFHNSIFMCNIRILFSQLSPNLKSQPMHMM